MSTAQYRIGVDVGGTFTDFVVAHTNGGILDTFKVPSTPHDPAAAVVTGLEQLLGTNIHVADISHIVHGTTIGLNAIVQRRGAQAGLVVTRGFRDVMQLTQRLPEEFNLRQPHLVSLVERALICETTARFGPQGEVLAETSDAELEQLARELTARGVESVAVSLLHGYANPAVEALFADRLSHALGGVVPVSSAASIWPEIREYERTALSTINAYIHPLMGAYFDSLQASIESLGITAPLFVTTNGGGCMGVEAAKARPVETILSGPASGVVAAGLLTRDPDTRGMITLDMGGTSTDISIITDAGPSFATRTEVGGIPLITPVVDINAIGTGGGSIVSVDAHGMLRVGPESAGADPGPIAFGCGGTELTLTDVFLLAGIISPAVFVRRFGALEIEAARDAALQIADTLKVDGPDRLANILAAILELSAVVSTSEMHKVLARHGYSAHEFSIVPFGGAGPVTGALLAEEVGSTSLTIPLQAGTFCALGAAWSPIRREVLRGVGLPLNESVDTLRRLVVELRDEAVAWAHEQLTGATASTQAEAIHCVTSFSGRYRGQAFALETELDADDFPHDVTTIAQLFHAEHDRAFGFIDEHSPIEVASVKAVVTVPAQSVAKVGVPLTSTTGGDASPLPTRPVLSRGSWVEARIYTEETLVHAGKIDGVSIIDLPDTTVLIPAGWRAELTADQGAVIVRKDATR